MRDRASLILFVFLIIILIIMAQNGTLGGVFSDLSNGFSVTVQPGYATVRPLSFVTPTAGNQVLPAPVLPTAYLPPAYAPTYPAAQPPVSNGPASNAPAVQPGAVNATGQCVVPNGWTAYTIQAGETLGTIAAAYNLTVDQLAAANCISNPNLVYEGQIIAVPGAQ
ncbi:MAG: LysM peptidoglycan-binding domain-containing protein [Anaerolineae bacterium]|nr:LysM peptidoglycan-binding domain-containing protein [Anaerolineae bacterium]